MARKAKKQGKKQKPRAWRRPAALAPGLALAVEAVGGTMAKLARLLDISPQAVAQWTEVPLDRMLEVEHVTGVERERLRPDLFRQPRSGKHRDRPASLR